MGFFARKFEKLLTNLNKKNSVTDNCIEVYLMKSERKYFDMYTDAQLKKQPKAVECSLTGAGLNHAVDDMGYGSGSPPTEQSESYGADGIDQWLSRLGYRRPIAIQRFMRWRVGNWPIYALFLGLGQIIATNSAQITLLVGHIGETATKLYVIAAIYCLSSIVWWFLSSRFHGSYTALHSLSLGFRHLHSHILVGRGPSTLVQASMPLHLRAVLCSLLSTSVIRVLFQSKIGCSEQASYKVYNSYTQSLCGSGVPESLR
jgi:glycogen synthase